jgi:UDP-N-acetylglucosamine pyrophosphorylase
MIIVKNVNIDYNKISKLNEDKKRIMNILKEVKIIYKSNKELIDFKKEMVKASYWEIIEKEIYIILGIDHLDLTPENLRTLTMKLNL